MDHEFLLKALDAASNKRSCAFATVVETTLKGTPRKSGTKMIVFDDGESFGSIGGGRNELAAQKECLKAIKSGRSSLVTYDFFGGKGQSICGGQMKVFIEPFKERKKLLICGAGHIAHPLSVIAKMLDFKVNIIDNRRSYANKKKYPHVDKIYVGDHRKILKSIDVDPQTFIMIVTQGNEYDFRCLDTVIKSNAAYIGVISSKAKKTKFSKRLKDSGIPDSLIKKVRIPAGIDIGAQTPEEIAVSICSEIISTANKASVGTEKFRHKI